MGVKAVPATGPGPRALRLVAVLVSLVFIGVLLVGCGTSLARTPRMSTSWSKGLPLGLAALNNRVGLAVDGLGNVYTVWVSTERDLHFVRLDERARVQVDRALDLEVSRPQQPKLALDAAGSLHLVWLDKHERGMQVRYARLSPVGEVLTEATTLSESALVSAQADLTLDGAGQTVQVFWSDKIASRPGLYHAALDWAGTVILPEEMLVPDGLAPSAQGDGQGFVHLAWRTEPEGEPVAFAYAVYDPQRRALGPELKVGEPVVQASLLGGPAAGGRFDGPHLGLIQDAVYVAWSFQVRPRGQLVASTFYQSFPQPDLGQPGGAEPWRYALPQVTAEPVLVRGGDPALTGDPTFLAGEQTSQVLACFTQAYGPRNLEMLQSAVVYLPGQNAGMDVVSATSGASLRPNVAADGQGYLHLVWVDTAGFNRYKVIYASTAPQVQEVLNPVTLGEVLSQGLELGFGALTIIGFLPLFLMWALPGFVVLLVGYFVTQAADLDQPHGALILWLAVGVHAVVKLMTAGGALERLSSGSALAAPGPYFVVRWLVPLAITGLAILSMRFYTRRSGNRSIFASFFVFVLADAVLFSVVYLTPLLLLG